jgi:hypothetical protein
MVPIIRNIEIIIKTGRSNKIKPPSVWGWLYINMHDFAAQK